MSEEKMEWKEDKVVKTENIDETTQQNDVETETFLDAQETFSESYRKLPVWKQVILLALFLGGMTAVIMLINFVVEFGADIIKALINH